MNHWLKFAVAGVMILALFAFASPATAAEEAGGGAFLACYSCTTGKPGAPTLTLHLVVSPVTKQVSGNATLTQAVSPPVNLHVPVHGHIILGPIIGGGVGFVATGGQPGGALVTQVILPTGWKGPGKCIVQVMVNGRPMTFEAPVKPIPCN
jgi:hypothetical protein